MFCLTLHNIEEALWLTKWRQKTMPNSRRSGNNAHFIFAVIGITLLGYLAAGFYMLYPDYFLLELCFTGFVGAMLINAIVPHLLLTIKYRSYCPGVFTGCLLLIPFNSIILYRAVVTHLRITEVVFSTIIVGVILLAAIPVFEKAAKHFLKDI